MFFLELTDGLIDLILGFLELFDLNMQLFAVAAVLLHFLQRFLQLLYLRSQLFLLLQKLSILLFHLFLEKDQIFVLLINLSELLIGLVLSSL